MIYYALKNSRKTPFSELKTEYLERLLEQFKNSPRGDWINVISKELIMRERRLKIDNIITNVYKKN